MLVAFLAAVLANPNGSAPLPEIDRIRACRAKVGEERLRCFEQGGIALLDAIDARTVVIAAAPMPADPRERFGTRTATPKPAKVASPPLPRIDSIESTVASATALANGRWSVRLQSGSQWRTLEAGYAFTPHVGDKIVIRRGALGSYRASFAGQSPLLIQRSR